tara:strand:+ start:1683 stop:1973 length:291 start_codon:yes stop_codon:yes gene_type:complete
MQMDTANLVKKGDEMKGLDPIQRANIVRQQIQILDNTEGVTQDVIDRAEELLLHAEEEEANYIAELDYINGEQAKTESDLSNRDIEDMAKHYEEGL